jgi:hypothetical protein
MSTSSTQAVWMHLEEPLSTSLVNVGGYWAEVLLGDIVGQGGAWPAGREGALGSYKAPAYKLTRLPIL